MTTPNHLGPETTTDDVLEGVDLSETVAVVTGASGGIGEETARALASRGALVVIAARDDRKLADAQSRITDSGVSGSIETLQLDLASLDSVRGAAAELSQRHPQINLLVNNAGVMAPPLGRTSDGFELQFGTNHLGHFLFTLLLEPNLRAGAPARVVELSSAGHRTSPILWDDPNFEHSEYHNFTAYGQSKTANALFALELDRRWSADGVHTFSVHPGVILTDLSRHLTPEDLQWMADRARAESGDSADDSTSGESAEESIREAYQFKSIPQGAATSVWAATAADLEDHGGAYLEDCHVAAPAEDPSTSGGVQTWARDPEQARRLWDLSVDLVGLQR